MLRIYIQFYIDTQAQGARSYISYGPMSFDVVRGTGYRESSICITCQRQIVSFLVGEVMTITNSAEASYRPWDDDDVVDTILKANGLFCFIVF